MFRTRPTAPFCHSANESVNLTDDDAAGGAAFGTMLILVEVDCTGALAAVVAWTNGVSAHTCDASTRRSADLVNRG